MSIWTSSARRIGGASLLAGLLAGCMPGDGPGWPFAGPPSDPPPGLMAVAGGEVIVGGPRGFCIDRPASQDRHGGNALVVLSGCAGLGAGPFAPAPRHPAILTATVSPAGAAVPVNAVVAPALIDWFASRDGRAQLSRSGQAETVELREARFEAEAILLHLSDSAPFPGGEIEPAYWRAVLELGDRAVTLIAVAPAGRPFEGDQGRVLLLEFLTRIRQETADRAKPAG